MAKNNLDNFKTTKEGKRIRQFGILLIIYAIITFLVSLIFMFMGLTTSPLLFIQTAIGIPVSIYLIKIGSVARKYGYDPYKLKNKVVAAVVATIVGTITGVGIVLGPFVWVGAGMLIRNWNKKYAQAYNTKHNSSANDISTNKPRAKDVKENNREEDPIYKKSIKERYKKHRRTLIIFYYSAASIIITISIGIILNNSITRTEIVESEEPIYFYTEYEDDDSLELGVEKTRQSGENGIKKIYTEEKKKLITGELRNSTIIDVETIKEPTNEIIRRGTRKWQYMICSDGSYRYYTDEQFKNKNTGFTHALGDNCAKNNQGTMIGLADTPPAVSSYTSDGRLSEAYIRAMEIRAEYEQELRNKELSSTSTTEPFESSINYDLFADQKARQEAEQQARAAAESTCKTQAEIARGSAIRQLGAMGVGGSQLTTIPQSAYDSTYRSCMRGYGY